MDEAERSLLYLSGPGPGPLPRQIYARSPQVFPSVQDVYRMKRNVLDRLRRSRADAPPAHGGLTGHLPCAGRSGRA